MKHIRHRFLPTATVCFLAAMLISSPLAAKTNWWDTGKDLLQNLGEKSTGKALSTGDIAEGLKEALRVGADHVVAQLGRADGFNFDSAVHIPLPPQFDTVVSVLKKIGLSAYLDELELKLNRAAEVAIPRAKKIFGQAITDMSFEDVKKIYNGPQDAATQYFKDKMSPALSEEIRPVIDQSLAEVGALQTYDKVINRYRSVPFVPDVKADLSDYVIAKGIDGIYYYLAKEEAAIRQDPAKQTTALLKRVFGAGAK